jgi:hypothetical protein
MPQPDMIDRLLKLELYAWVGEDELGSGEIGIKQAIVPAGCIPIVATTREKVDRPFIREQMQTMVDQYGKTRFLVRFQFNAALASIVPTAHEKTPAE